MKLLSIRDVSKNFSVSTRTLRYYEEVGLLGSIRDDENGYRAYDDKALRRLSQILALRALRLPLRQIEAILRGEKGRDALAILEAHTAEITNERITLSHIEAVLSACVTCLRNSGLLMVPVEILGKKTAQNLARSATMPIQQIREDAYMTKLTNVRIVYLPPADVCGIIGKGPLAEKEAGDLIDQFILDNNLKEVKPDLRLYGFNHPNGVLPDGSDHGYEFWVTIPPDCAVPLPYEKKRFEGGLYAAHMIPMGAFEEWEWLVDWAKSSEVYEPCWGDEACMSGLLEEVLNYIHHVGKPQKEKDSELQLDLLMPIMPRKKAD